MLVRAGNYYTSITSTAIGLGMGMLTITSMVQMYCRLHTPAPESADLHLQTAGGKSIDPSEFYLASDPSEAPRR